MALNPDAKDFLSSKALPLLGGILMIYFTFHLLQGDKGILTYFSTQSALNTMKLQEETQRKQVEAMENKVSRLRPATFDKDFVEEQARTQAGLMRQDEKVILLDRQTN